MSKQEKAQGAPQRTNSALYSIVAAVIILGVIVAGIALNILNPRQDPIVTPIEPVDPPVVDIDYLQKGSFFIYGDEEYEPDEDYAIVNHWSDITDYLGDDEDALARAEKAITKTGYNLEPSENDNKYILIRVDNYYTSGKVENVGITRVNGDVAYVTIQQPTGCEIRMEGIQYWLIPIDKYDIDLVRINYDDSGSCYYPVYEEKKPVIYLYPEEDTEVDVKLGEPEKLTVSYPAYGEGWRVMAHSDGSLKDLKTNRDLYSLYYETKYDTTNGVREDGFVVKGADTAAFLEEKLAKLGLSDREAEEFIIYWLPQMQNNAYNYIHFADQSEIDKNMPLNVSPAPTTTIRINMEWKALDAPINVKEQKLPATPERKGFTLVEWGGTILK